MGFSHGGAGLRGLEDSDHVRCIQSLDEARKEYRSLGSETRLALGGQGVSYNRNDFGEAQANIRNGFSDLKYRAALDSAPRGAQEPGVDPAAL
jgi:hypothetical protein